MKHILIILFTLYSFVTYAQDETYIVSAFFGLDNSLPQQANALCLGAAGMDGMPLNFKYPIDINTLSNTDFEIIDSLGNSYTPHCVILRPADEDGENRTVLLIGEFGNNGTNPPAEVKIVGDLFTLANLIDESSCSEVINLNGQSTLNITPLNDGPTLFFAQRIDGILSECSGETIQTIQVAWDGGVTPFISGDTEEDLFNYYTGYTESSGGLVAHSPISITDINDNDNFHQLCFETNETIVKITINPAVVEDPNGDPNLYSEIEPVYCSDEILSTATFDMMGKERTILPNPVEDCFFIKEESFIGPVFVKILNVSGIALITKTFNGSNEQSIKVNCSSLPTGLYFVQCTNENMISINKIIIK